MTATSLIDRPTPVTAPDPAARDPWNEELGAAWRWVLLAFGIATMLVGTIFPLSDPDLPLHIATGEWIYAHGRVPFVEPFSWTRAGDAYYAYSWGVQLLYYVLLRAGGPAALHVLHGLLFAASAGVMFALGRAAGWRPWTTVWMAGLHLLLTLNLTPRLRPQIALFILVPLAWALALRVLDGARPRLAVLGLVVVGALAANTHFLFVLTALPALSVVTRSPVPWRRAALAAGALALGWVLSPYTAHYGAVLVQNLGGNALLVPPTPIAEYRPGFLRPQGLTLAIACLLAILPWGANRMRLTPRERGWYGLAWLAGLVSFGIAVRALLVWWLALLPLVALLLDRLPPPETAALRRMRLALVGALLLVIGVKAAGDAAAARRTGVPEGTIAERTLPATEAAAIEPLAAWLAEHAPGRRGRLLTVMMYGGYLQWRLPWLSASIDGRAIFPDSAALPDAYRHPLDGAPALGPWRSADVAIVPVRYAVAAVLDTAQGWRRVRVPMRRTDRPVAGLWVREAWLAAARGAAPAASR